MVPSELVITSSFPQSPKLRYYTSYEEDSLTLVMRHMAKNVVRVNRNLTKYTVSIFCLLSAIKYCCCSSAAKGSYPGWVGGFFPQKKRHMETTLQSCQMEVSL